MMIKDKVIEIQLVENSLTFLYRNISGIPWNITLTDEPYFYFRVISHHFTMLDQLLRAFLSLVEA